MASNGQQRYWLLKTEPNTYSYEDLNQDGETNWSGVRNFQARKFLKAAQRNDFALIYHSGDEKAVVGIAKVVREAYPDPDPKKSGEWVQIDIKKYKALKRPVTLQQIKAEPKLKDLLLIRQSRLSVMPVEENEFKVLEKLGGLAG